MTKRSGIEVFIKLWAEWKSLVPPAIARADPGRVIRLLELSGRKGGIFQSELITELEMNQPALSKLTDKLVQAGYIVRQTAKHDGRTCRTLTSAKGREFLAGVDRALSAAVPGKLSKPSTGGRWRGIRPAAGQQEFDIHLE